MRTRFQKLGVAGAFALLAMFAAGCAAGKAFRQGDAAVHGGDLDQAVVYYRKAAQAAPDNANYKIALERTLLAASRAHLDKAREFESKDQLEAALGEYRIASEYDPSTGSPARRSPRWNARFASAPRPPARSRRFKRCASARARLNRR